MRRLPEFIPDFQSLQTWHLKDMFRTEPGRYADEELDKQLARQELIRRGFTKFDEPAGYRPEPSLLDENSFKTGLA
jgi:hypothetical protein